MHASKGRTATQKRKKKSLLQPDDALIEGTEHEADVRHTKTSC